MVFMVCVCHALTKYVLVQEWLQSSEKRGVKRPKISEEERLATMEQLTKYLTQKSGSKNASFYYASDEALFDAYTAEFDSVCERLATKNVSIPKTKRQFRTLRYRLLKQFKVIKRSCPHPCPRCVDADKAEEDHNELKTRLDIADSDPEYALEIQEDILAVQKRLARGKHHRIKNLNQRRMAQITRDTLHKNPDVLALYMDYVSWFRGDGHKINDLVMTLEYCSRDGSETVDRKFLDFINLDRAKHDHRFTGKAFAKLFEEGKHLNGFGTIYIFCDNAMVNKYCLYWFSVLQHQYGIKIVIVPLCEHHAYSLCDSHGGSIKPIFRKLDTASSDGMYHRIPCNFISIPM